MLIQTFWTAATSSLLVLVVSSVLAGIFYLYGHFFIKQIRLPDLGSESYLIALGMTVITFFGWYVCKAGLSVDYYITGVFVGAILLLLFALINNRKNIRHCMQFNTLYLRPTLVVIPLFALLFAIQALIAFRSATYPIGTNGNNDLFTWSTLADQVLGSAGYWHVFPGDKNVMAILRIDSWGSAFILAIVVKLMHVLAVEAAPYFLVFALVLIALAMFELIKRVFKFNSTVSFMIALLTSGGAFFFYLTYNYFLGELLATFFYLVAIVVIYHLIYCSRKPAVTKTVLVLLAPLMGIFLVYQSAFLVFFTYLLVLCVFSVLARSFTRFRSYDLLEVMKSIVKNLTDWFYSFFCTLLIIGCLLPELTLYVVRRTLMIASFGVGGWSLGLISPFYLFALPCRGIFPGQLGHYLFQYSVIFIVAFSSFFFLYRLASQQKPKFTSNQLGLIFYFVFSLLTYYAVYFLKGDFYQAWKLVAYVELPISFIFLSVLAAPFYYARIGNGFFRKLLSSGLAFMCLGVVTLQPEKMHLPLNSLSPGLAYLKQAKALLDQHTGIENVVLATRPYGETMLAFDVLANDYKLFPLSASYLPSAGPQLIKQLDEAKTYVLKCSATMLNGFSNNDYHLVPLNEFLRGAFREHSFRNDVPTLDDVYLLDGFSIAEAWGVWTEGHKAHLLTKIPDDLIAKKMMIVFKVKPFTVGQTFSARVNGYFLGSWRLDTTEMKMISMRIPAAATQQGKLNFYFYVDHPVSPKELSTYANDTRKLGIGFSSFKLVSNEL